MISVEKYPVEIRTETSRGITLFVASFKDFDDISGVADNPQEALKEAYEALEAFFEVCQEDGISIPDPKDDDLDKYNGRLTIRMPKKLHRDLVNYSEYDGLSLNYIVVDAIRLYLTSQSLTDIVNAASEAIRENAIEANPESKYLQPDYKGYLNYNA